MIESQLVTTAGTKIPLAGVSVVAEILGAHARVVVKQRYRNEETRPVEAVYTFPLPADASLAGFAMACEGRRLDAELKGREEAFRAYDDALVAGHGAALLEQERANVFTANVGNLLPREETVIEVEYLQRLTVDEGSLRWMLPTLVAPRYIPGAPQGDRTGGGRADPTDAVPDADRITPQIGAVAYGLQLDLVLRLAGQLEVNSPSHAIQVRAEDGCTRVSFATREVALDRDVVIVARGVAEGPLTGVLAHREGTEPGYFALSVVPDLFDPARPSASHDVVFLIDTSGSMDGDSIVEARSALRLCLRHLREGDRFNIVEFNSGFRSFAPASVAFGEKSLTAADAWVAALSPTGGTELLQPLVHATKLAGNGVVVLLTDGQVGNERQILEAVLAARQGARILSFGIGTNVSDALLRDLARQTGGAVEFIHPGERIDEKVVAQFGRALAPRITGVTLKLRGLEIGELAPVELPSLVDGDPWVVFGRYASPGRGTAELRGTLDGRPFAIDVPVHLPEANDLPAIRKLWASERIRDLEAQEVSGRRAGAMKARITELSLAHGVACAHTSFVVVEKRTGDRLNQQGADTRFVPVNAPAGWAMFQKPAPQGHPALYSRNVFAGPPITGSMMLPPPAPPPAAAPAASIAFDGMSSGGAPPPMRQRAEAKKSATRGVFEKAREVFKGGAGKARKDEAEVFADRSIELEESLAFEPAPVVVPEGGGLTTLLGTQLASGLWNDPKLPGSADEKLLRATARALLTLLDEGVTTSHALYGAQVKKAVEALAPLAAKVAATDAKLAGLALGIAWLVASGRRSRAGIEAVVKGSSQLKDLSARLADEVALRAEVAAIRG